MAVTSVLVKRTCVVVGCVTISFLFFLALTRLSILAGLASSPPPATPNNAYAQLPLTSGLPTGTIQDIEHVVLFMQENRAFDHYFGTMAGVRGFKDPNVQMNDGKSVFYQKTGSLSDKTDHLLPWYLNYLHGVWDSATQCMTGGSNGWKDNHAALNHDLNDGWVTEQNPWAWGHFTRAELPAHFAIAEAWTVGDMYQESEIASTNPNRIAWISGSINSPGSPQNPNQGGMIIDNNETPGCERNSLNCYPLKWTTFPEHLSTAGVSWQVYQDIDNFDDNPLAFFQQFQTAERGSEYYERGLARFGLERFYEDAASGNLPAVSIIIGPKELSEHAPHLPRDGAWLQAQIVNTVTKSPLYKNTALLISYDESGGWGDHVVPYHSPPGTPGEWVDDPYTSQPNPVYVGPGFRTPFYIVSPWTRGGNVYVEHADHSSQIMFLERWLEAKGHNMSTPEIPDWRRGHMADLTRAFDFAHPNYSLPILPNVTYPLLGKRGAFNGDARCEAEHKTSRPPVPYGAQTEQEALLTEDGWKGVRGQLTEGRFLVMEMNGFALTPSSGNSTLGLGSSKTTPSHELAGQRFVLKNVDEAKGTFELMDRTQSMSTGTFTFTDLGGGQGYSMQSESSGKYVAIGKNGTLSGVTTPAGFQVFSVTYS